MATASRHSSGPHGSGASLEELKGWRAFLHLASELKLSGSLASPTPTGGAPSSASWP